MRNKISRKKNNHWQIMVIFTMLLFMVCYSCRVTNMKSDRSRDTLGEEHKARAIEDAKAWYEANRPEDIRSRSSGEEAAILIKAEWSQAFATANDTFQIVETNLMIKKIFMYIDNDCMEKYKETNDPKYRQCYTRMVFRTDRKTNETVGFLMTVVPNLDWLEKSNFKPFPEVTYLYRSKHFGGMILFHDMDGNFVTGWKYIEGKIVGTINSLNF